MTGIDFTRAGIDVRQCFSFTKKAMAEAMEIIKKKKDIRGCVILSTCNRMELWVSLTEDAQLRLPEFLCRLKGLRLKDYQEYLVVRENEKAVGHLFYLSAGMKSQILGEDQILTQVKEAVSFAREQECTDHVLEVLFRMAVTAGKQVKTNVPMDKANFSAAHRAVEYLKEQGNVLSGKKCLVIGNGEMGKLTALALMEEGADVTVTVRQYKSGVVNIPQGAKRINYGERYQYIPECDVIFSATASPNLTITKAELEKCLDLQEKRVPTVKSELTVEEGAKQEEQIYVDLAVPRDMEQSIQSLEHIRLYDIDSFHMDARSERMRRQYSQADQILKEEMQKFFDWQECRDMVPRIQNIGEKSAQEMVWRMEKSMKGLSIAETEKEQLKHQMEQTAGKVVDKLLFALRDRADTELLRQVVEIMEQVYEDKPEMK